MSSLPRVCLCWTTCAADELELLGFIALKRSAAVRRCQLTHLHEPAVPFSQAWLKR